MAPVAFTATVSPADITGLGPGRTIVFDNVITNKGHAYDKMTGKFDAPFSGVYVFTMSVMVSPGQKEYLEIVKDGQNVITTLTEAFGVTDMISSSRTATVELTAGNQVWIRTVNASYHGTGQIHGNNYTTFTGWFYSMTY